MSQSKAVKHTNAYHRFIDEAGDLTFFGKGGISILGHEGVSKAFMLGMLKYNHPLNEIRDTIIQFTDSVSKDPFFNQIPSVKKRLDRGHFYLHANEDPPELRYKFFELMRTDISFHLQVVVGRKDVTRFVNKHNKQEREFYGDLLSHMLHDKANYKKLVLNIASLGSTTRVQDLESALLKAQAMYLKNEPDGNYQADVKFNVQAYIQEPLLSVVDYGLWAVQRVFEKGETRFYDSIRPKVRSVVDVYDPAKKGRPTHYNYRNNPLTASNHLVLKRPTLL